MITEDYCSYEVAKLLKEKGFVQETLMVYSQNGNFMPNGAIEDTYQIFYPVPTHQMAMKWLRKVHNILLFILPGQENGKLVYLVEVWTWNEEEGVYESTYAPMPRKEPEQAVEAALKYTLENLI